MLRSFINAKTGEKIRLSKWEHDREELEKELKMEIEWDIPFSDSPEAKKRWRPRKETLESNNEE